MARRPRGRPTPAGQPLADHRTAAGPAWVYLLSSGRRLYIGATTDPARRLREHNGELAGGARRTRGQLWALRATVGPFRDFNHALSLERSWQLASRGARTVAAKLAAVDRLLQRPANLVRWPGSFPAVTVT